MAKDISKSIRLSQEDFDFIDSYPGESFSEKLDNMIILMRSEVPRKLDEVRRIDNSIKAKRAEFRNLSRYVSDLNELVIRANRVSGELRSVERCIDQKFGEALTLPFSDDADS